MSSYEFHETDDELKPLKKKRTNKQMRLSKQTMQHLAMIQGYTSLNHTAITEIAIAKYALEIREEFEPCPHCQAEERDDHG